MRTTQHAENTRIGHLHSTNSSGDVARSALILSFLLGVAALALMAFSSTTMTQAVALPAPVESSAQAVA